MKTQTLRADHATITATLDTLYQPGTVAELRILDTLRAGTVSGYFDDFAALAKAAEAWSGRAGGVYVTLNPCVPSLLARAVNHVKERAKSTTADNDIVRRCWLPLDFDPQRPSGISATDEEKATAMERTRACLAWLSARGWPAPVQADGGNSGHLLYPIELSNDTASRDLLKRCLEALALHFSDDDVMLDQSVYNAARIWKLHGTLACKGDNLPERPHRLARLLDVPATLTTVTPAQLEALAALIPESPKNAPRPSSNGHSTLDLDGWLAKHGLTVASRKPWNGGGTRWVLNPCPWNAAHTDRSAFVVQFASGAIAAGCHHNGCQGHDWHTLRDLVEPGWRQQDRQTTTPRNASHDHNGHAKAPEQEAQRSVPLKPALITRCAADVQPEAVEWLWQPYIALGTLCMLDGDPGIGKSLLITQLAANVSRGHPFPDQTGKPTVNKREPANVLIMTREDSLAKTIRPRLDASKADVNRVFVSANWLDAAGKEQAFTLKHLPLLEDELQRLRPRLVVLDPIQSFFGDIDMHRANQTRPLLDALAALADKYQCAIVCIRHPAKPGEGIGKALHRGLGSIDIIGAARTGLFIEEYPSDKTRALMTQTKSNLGPKGRTLIFSKKEGIFGWERATRLTDDDLAGSGRGPNHHTFLEALLWLEQRLEGGLAWSAGDIETEAEHRDISTTLLKRAKKSLGVISTQVKGAAHAGWTWRLPPLTLSPNNTPTTDSSESTDATDSSDISDQKSKTYENSLPPESEVPEASEGSEGSEDGVVIDDEGPWPEPPEEVFVPTNGMHNGHAPPSVACPQCRSISLHVVGAYASCRACHWKGMATDAYHPHTEGA